MSKYRIALVHNIISPYRVPLFLGLSSHPDIEMEVYYCARTHRRRKWDIPHSDDYNFHVLKGLTLEHKDFVYHINPSIWYHISRGGYDAVIIGGYSDFTTELAFITAKILKIPVILWSEGIEDSKSSFSTLVNPIFTHIIRSIDAIIVPGSVAYNYHVQKGADKNNIFIAPNIVDNDYYINQSSTYKAQKGMLKLKVGIKSEKVILFVGRVVKLKGLELLINSFQRLQMEMDGVGLVIVGEGPLKQELEERCIRESIENVYFPGWKDGLEKIMYYSIADLFVLPTLKDNCPLVVNEAMCCRLPVICTDVAGCAIDMVLPGENGYIISPSDDNLFWSMKSIITDDQKIEVMGKRSLEIIKSDFNVNRTVNGFLSAIKFAYERKN